MVEGSGAEKVNDDLVIMPHLTKNSVRERFPAMTVRNFISHSHSTFKTPLRLHTITEDISKALLSVPL
jgi:hypothetical protein